MDKLDLRKDPKYLYSPSPKSAEILDVPPMHFLMVDGMGGPDKQEFGDAMKVLYSVAYTLKFTLKKQKAVDYPVMALEGVWWVAGPAGFGQTDRSQWLWTVMIMQPDIVTEDAFRQVVEDLREKKNPPLLDRIRLEIFHEGLSAQIMHIGPYATETATIDRLHSFIRTSGYIPNGKHHEIYLGDPNRSAPDKLKTILRQPIMPAA